MPYTVMKWFRVYQRHQESKDIAQLDTCHTGTFEFFIISLQRSLKTFKLKTSVLWQSDLMSLVQLLRDSNSYPTHMAHKNPNWNRVVDSSEIGKTLEALSWTQLHKVAWTISDKLTWELSSEFKWSHEYCIFTYSNTTEVPLEVQPNFQDCFVAQTLDKLWFTQVPILN